MLPKAGNIAIGSRSGHRAGSLAASRDALALEGELPLDATLEPHEKLGNISTENRSGLPR